MSWMFSYLLGICFFGFGMGWALGLPAVPIVLGAVMILGGFGQFLLEKIASIPPAERET